MKGFVKLSYDNLNKITGGDPNRSGLYKSVDESEHYLSTGRTVREIFTNKSCTPDPPVIIAKYGALPPSDDSDDNDDNDEPVVVPKYGISP